ncbi:MAG: Holliday junction resolvase RuvX [Actinobacteria bacterium]|nr:Holliday junction resolvase RuvX [Actinomycetota bacterium]
MVARANVLGVDPGTKRIGLAIADTETRFAHPLVVLDATATSIDRIVEIANEHDVVTIVVGKPIGLSGRAGPAVETQKVFVEKLRSRTDIPIEEFDERLTTVVAEAGLRASGSRPEQRKDKRDAIAAQLLLQGFLDATA